MTPDRRRRALTAALMSAGWSPRLRAADTGAPPRPGAWVVVVEGETRTRTLRLSDLQADGADAWLADGRYGYTGGNTTPQRVRWRVEGGRHRVRFVTAAKSVVEVEGDEADRLEGRFVPVSGVPKAVALHRVLSGSTASPFVDAPGTALPEPVELPVFHPGDLWHWEQREPVGGPVTDRILRVVTSVTAEEVRGSDGKASFTMTPDLMVMQNRGTWVRGEPRMFSFPMVVGKQWDFAYSFGTQEVDRGRQRYRVEVLASETVTVPAGTFRALRLRGVGSWFNHRVGAEGSGTFTVWYAPAVKNLVKWGYVDRGTNSMRELIEFQVRP